jgi:hypothetical protein
VLLNLRANSAPRHEIVQRYVGIRAVETLTTCPSVSRLHTKIPIQAQGEAVIRKALTELRLWGLTREFSFADPKPDAPSATPAPGKPPAAAPHARAASSGGGGGGGGGGVALIKGWGEVLGEVSDHQALVGSLRQSAYYSLFKVGAGKGRAPHLMACCAGLQLAFYELCGLLCMLICSRACLRHAYESLMAASAAEHPHPKVGDGPAASQSQRQANHFPKPKSTPQP